KALDALTPILTETEFDADTLSLMGEVYVQNGDLARATGLFEKAAQLDPKNPARRTVLALSHMGVAGENERGFRELEEAAAADKGFQADIALVTSYVQKKKFDAALTAVDALEKKLPDSPLPDSLRGEVFLTKGDVASARKSFERAMAKDLGYFVA